MTEQRRGRGRPVRRNRGKRHGEATVVAIVVSKELEMVNVGGWRVRVKRRGMLTLHLVSIRGKVHRVVKRKWWRVAWLTRERGGE